MMISFMFHNVKQLFQTLKQEFNNNKKVVLPWDISKIKNDSKRQGFECLSWDNILFYIHTYCLQYERVHFEYLLEMKIFIFFCPMVTDFTNLTRFTLIHLHLVAEREIDSKTRIYFKLDDNHEIN